MPTCPDAVDWQELLAGCLPDGQAAQLRAHLHDCSDCRDRLDELSDPAELRPWRAALVQQHPVDTRIERLLQALRETPVVRASQDAMPAGEGLAFLGPPVQEGDLGTLGSYRILSEIGRGGMGIVFRAYDDILARGVAIKVLRAGLDDATARRRFVREVRAAAAVRHDHVVPVYTVSEPDARVPYLVMEYIEGPTLRERLRSEGRLDPYEAARLVHQAADGLAAAHAHGLIHRDVKPANIMYDLAGNRVRLVDFGLARAQDHAGGTTNAGALLGTPEYMSPEQLRWPEQLDARTDIYSLGVTLYELLTGDVPFRGVPHLVMQRVLHDDPIPIRRLNDRVPRDLETVCLKALAKEPDRRYRSMAELAADLERFLTGQPVRARPIGPMGRARRWCRRNPWIASLSAALFIAFAAGSAAVVWQWRRAEVKAAEAEISYAEARTAVDTFYKDVYEKHLLDRPGLEKERRHLLQELLRYYRGFAAQRGKDLNLQAEVAEAYDRIGMMESVVGSKTAALEAFLQAAACYEVLSRTAPDDRHAIPLAPCHSNAGLMLVKIGKPREAVPHYQAYHVVMLREYKTHPQDTTKVHALANSWGNLGMLHYTLGQLGESRHAFQQALVLHEKLVRLLPNDIEPRIELGKTYNNLGMVSTDPLTWYEKALSVREGLLRSHPRSFVPRFELAGTLIQLGQLYGKQGRSADSLRLLRRARTLLQEALAIDPVNVSGQDRLGVCLMYLGKQQQSDGQWAAALRNFEAAAEVFTRLGRINPEEFGQDVKSMQAEITQCRQKLAAGAVGHS